MVFTAAMAAILLAGIGIQQQAPAQGTSPDRTSKVPQYTFADTLEEQEAELKRNPLLQRMIASRKPLRPTIRIARSIIT